MKKYFSLLLIILSAGIIASCLQEKTPPEKKIAELLVKQIDSFATTNEQLKQAIAGNMDAQTIQQRFRQTRLTYKRIEWATEYFVPLTTRFINGAPVPEVEPTNNQVFEPQGLQVIEALLYPKYDPAKKEELLKRIELLQAGCKEYKAHFNDIDILEGQVFDAVKLEVFRILTLGITGFDTPLLQNSIEESGASLDGLRAVMAYYTGKKDEEQIQAKLNAAIKYLQNNRDFNAFDRAAFITQFGNPITIAVTDLETRLRIHVIRYNRLLNQNAKTLFEKDAFNVNAYTPNIGDAATDKKIALGKKLFADPILSGDGSRSCQSCHQPEKAFTDGLMKNTELRTGHALRRNTPTLFNTAFQPAQFYDSRSVMLEDQAMAVIENEQEMHGSVHHATKALWNNKEYRQLFATAYNKKEKDSINDAEVLNAIGSYIRSLISLNSRFDQYMNGNKTEMNQQELNGFNLFMGKAKCGTCHYMPLFNGTFPPRYMKIESEVIGVPQFVKGNAIDTDMGRYNIVPIEFYKHSFKTTTVRNAARTAPYMHNGVYKTLEEVVDFYNKGGGAGMGMNISNQTLPTDKLNLSEQECRDLVSFIKSLDESRS